MTVHKNIPNILKKGKSSFTTNLNSTLNLIRDPASLGIYVYLSSKCENWHIQETELMRHFESGRDFIRKRLRYLKDIGLISKTSLRDIKGKIISWETILYCSQNENPFFTHGVETHITENPVTGKTRDWKTPPPINKRDIKIKEDYTHSEIENSEELEDILFFEPPKRKLAIVLKDRCLKNNKCRVRYDELPSESKQDKSYMDLLNECITYYGTKAESQLVGPERFLTWITNEVRHCKSNWRNVNKSYETKKYFSQGNSVSPQPPLFTKASYDKEGSSREEYVHPLLKNYLNKNKIDIDRMYK